MDEKGSSESSVFDPTHPACIEANYCSAWRVKVDVQKFKWQEGTRIDSFAAESRTSGGEFSLSLRYLMKRSNGC